MKCKQIRRLVHEFVDGTLAATKAGSVSEHIAACELCARHLRVWRRIREGFACMPRAGMPRSVVTSVMREGAEPRRPAFGFALRPAFRALAVAGSLALIAGTALLMLPRGDRQPDLAPRLATTAASRFGEAVERDADLKVAMLDREHAMFARGGTALDRTLWTAAATEANLELFNVSVASAPGGR